MKIKVLIVDDDKLARMGLIALVPWEACGMEVVGEAANGERAMAFLEENSVDLAVVDLAMPVMPGLEFIKKSKAKWSDLQYIVLSFHEDFQSVQAALRLGTLDYISKMRLDQQDCQDVFMRVGALLRQTSNGEAKREIAQVKEKSEQWLDIEADWMRFYWLYDQEQLELLLDATRKSAPIHRDFEHLLVRIFDKIRVTFAVEDLPEVPPISTLDSGLIWLIEAKNALAKCLENREALSSNEACIFCAVMYILAHIDTQLCMHTVAVKVGISRSYFALNFKKATGLTFNQFVRKERVNLAKRLIDDGSATIGNVAQKVGYEDEKYFARLFLDLVGVPLSVYGAKGGRKETLGQIERKQRHS